MSTIRQQKIEAAIKNELSSLLQKHTLEFCLGQMVTVTVVRVTRDLSLAKCYLSIFPAKEPEKVLIEVKTNQNKIRGELGKRLKNMRKIPEFAYFIDDSLEYAAEIDRLLKTK